jgi:hypothetical protein
MSDVTIDGLSTNELVTVVELQRVELNRLLAEQRRLNDRIDKMLHMQEREQVLRQQMQVALDRLAEQKSLPGQVSAPPPQLVDRLNRTERKFNALQLAVGQLIDFIERRERNRNSSASAPDGVAPESPII